MEVNSIIIIIIVSHQLEQKYYTNAKCQQGKLCARSGYMETPYLLHDFSVNFQLF